MKKCLVIAMLFLSGCTIVASPDGNLLRQPVELPNYIGYGETCVGYLFYNPFWGVGGEGKNSAIDAAINGRITKIIHADTEYIFYPFFYLKCVRVWGETNSPPVSEVIKRPSSKKLD